MRTIDALNVPENDMRDLRLVDVQRDDQKDSLALTFQDTDTNTIYVAFKGTGANEWPTDLQGLYATDTAAQQDASAYVLSIHAKYPHSKLILTGHSNGANKAMYATVMTGGIVDECYAFDGQGFSDSFCSLYADRIAAYRDRLHAVNCENDFVSSFMRCIVPEGNITYVKAQGPEGNPARFHSMSSLLGLEGHLERSKEGELHSFVRTLSDAIMSYLSVDQDMAIAAANYLGLVAKHAMGEGLFLPVAFEMAKYESPDGYIALKKVLVGNELASYAVLFSQLASGNPALAALALKMLVASGLSDLGIVESNAGIPGADSLPFHAGDPLVRDFSEEAQSELALQMSRLSNVWPLRGVDWDRWYGIEALRGAFDIRFALNSMRMDLRRVRELNEETRPRVTRLFETCLAAEREAAGKVSGVASELRAANGELAAVHA